ncbi:MAG: hypothetical protein JSV42_11960 [Chloroflexota bacterium]|nr:MAG: hypothetical protein JSV42_11960 [Chloroflexota bacterium]
MSKKILPILLTTAVILVVGLMALPGAATATQLLGITVTPTPTDVPPVDTPTPTLSVTEPPPTTEPPPATEPPSTTEPPPPTNTAAPRTPAATARPQATEVVLLPETGEFPIDPGTGLQWLFALTLIFLIGMVLIRTVVKARIRK